MKRYKAYEATKWEQRVDSLIRVASPTRAWNRMVSRERMNYFRYLSASQTSARRNAGPTTSGEWMRGSREKMQVMWNAINLVENSGLCSGILQKFETYCFGRLRWQGRTGDPATNKIYEDYVRYKCGNAANIDVSGRFTLRQMAMLDIKGIVLKGDIGTNIVRDGNEIYLQGIEADRIGDPYRYQITNKFVRGLVLDAVGKIDSVQVYQRNRMNGTYSFDQTFQMRDKFGLPSFLFLVNPISYDDYRGVSVFKTAIDNATYIEEMRKYELQALLWAASQSGVYYTESGLLPDKMPFDTDETIIDSSGNTIPTMQVRPNTLQALGKTEKVQMFETNRPSPNVMALYKETKRDIANGCGLTYGFVDDMSGLTGPAVRQCSAQDARAIEVWQLLLRETKLDPVVMLILGNAIANGDIPYHDKWMNWEWFYPAKTTIDVGRESAANIAEVEAGVNTGALVAAEAGQDIDEIHAQLGRETEQLIIQAQGLGKKYNAPWQEIYTLMRPPSRAGTGAAPFVVADQAGAQGSSFHKNGSRNGATSDGVELDNARG